MPQPFASRLPEDCFYGAANDCGLIVLPHQSAAHRIYLDTPREGATRWCGSVTARFPADHTLFGLQRGEGRLRDAEVRGSFGCPTSRHRLQTRGGKAAGCGWADRDRQRPVYGAAETRRPAGAAVGYWRASSS
jgi:hypothetical protein